MFYINVSLSENSREVLENFSGLKNDFLFEKLFKYYISSTGLELINSEINSLFSQLYCDSQYICLNIKNNSFSNENLYNLFFNLIDLNKPILLETPLTDNELIIAKDVGINFVDVLKEKEIDLSAPTISLVYTIQEIFEDNIKNIKCFNVKDKIFVIEFKNNMFIINNKQYLINFANLIDIIENNIHTLNGLNNNIDFLFQGYIPSVAFMISDFNTNSNEIEEYKKQVFNKIKDLSAEEWEKTNETLAYYLTTKEYISLSILKKLKKEDKNG